MTCMKNVKNAKINATISPKGGPDELKKMYLRKYLRQRCLSMSASLYSYMHESTKQNGFWGVQQPKQYVETQIVPNCQLKYRLWKCRLKKVSLFTLLRNRSMQVATSLWSSLALVVPRPKLATKITTTLCRKRRAPPLPSLLVQIPIPHVERPVFGARPQVHIALVEDGILGGFHDRWPVLIG